MNRIGQLFIKLRGAIFKFGGILLFKVHYIYALIKKNRLLSPVWRIKLELKGQKTIYIWYVRIFACFFFSIWFFAVLFFDFYQNYTAFWPLTSNFSIWREFMFSQIGRLYRFIFFKLNIRVNIMQFICTDRFVSKCLRMCKSKLYIISGQVCNFILLNFCFELLNICPLKIFKQIFQIDWQIFFIRWKLLFAPPMEIS